MFRLIKHLAQPKWFVIYYDMKQAEIYLADIWHLAWFVRVLHVLQEHGLTLKRPFTDLTLGCVQK